MKITDIERARRRQQSGDATVRRDRRRIREEAKATSPYRLDFKLDIAGGLLRSEYPSVTSGVVVGQDEADLLRGIVSKCVEQMYANAPREDVPKLFAGLICDVFNPAGMHVRGLIAYGIMAGLGLIVQEVETTYCRGCGVERTETDPEPEHQEGCQVTEFVTNPAILLDTIRKYPPLQTSAPEPEPMPEPEPDVEESGEVPAPEEFVQEGDDA